MKNKILDLLRSGGDLTLTNIQNQLGVQNKPTVLHHLKGLQDKGLIRKTQNKTYKIVDANGLPAEGVETIIIPKIIARAGKNDNVLEGNVSTGEIESKSTLYKPEDLIMVEVDGNSMFPTFNNGDLLLFGKMTDRPKNNDIVLWRVEDGAKIKRIKWAMDEEGEPYGLLISDNIQDPENTPIRIDDTNSEFIGRYLSIIHSAKP